MFSVSKSPADIIEVKDMAFVCKAIQESCGKNRIAEELSPPFEAFVGSNDNRGVFVELRYKPKEKIIINQPENRPVD